MRRALILALAVACSNPASRPVNRPPPPTGSFTLSLVGTNDLHGHLLEENGKGGVALFGAYLARIRDVRAKDGGAVLLLDGGDEWQGTLESNTNEGVAVIQAYDALGYDAGAIGNHEFDFGVVGPKILPTTADEDPRGALKARIAEAKFPFVATNLLDKATGAPVAWPNVHPSVIVEKNGVKIGLLGLSTEETATGTQPALFAGLGIAPLAEATIAEAKKLRAEGATIVIGVGHVGGKCVDDLPPDDISKCEPQQELMGVMQKLPPGTLDAFVAGHTHSKIAKVLHGVPTTEAWFYGKAFGRIDLTVDRATGKVTNAKIFEPEDMVEGATYEGVTIAPDPRVAAIVAPWADKARAAREEKLGVRLAGQLFKADDEESPLGNLFADLMLKSHPGTDVAITNGRGLRADLPAGDLTFGSLFESYPFDNRFAVVKISGKQLRHIFERNARETGQALDIAGAQVDVACKDGKIVASITRGGKPVGDDDTLTLLTSDYLAATTLKAVEIPEASITFEDNNVRETIATGLRALAGKVIKEGDVFDADHLRVSLPGARPISCQ
jgi:5'-nucleotidase